MSYLMGAGYEFLCFAEIGFSLVLYQVWITHTYVRVIVVKRDFRLRPLKFFALWRIDLDTTAKPDRVAILVGDGASLGIFADLTAAVVVKPVEEAAVLSAPGEIGGARMLDAATVGVGLVRRFGPVVAAVVAIGTGRIAVDGAIDAVERAVAECGIAVFLGDGPPARGGCEALYRPRARSAIGLLVGCVRSADCRF